MTHEVRTTDNIVVSTEVEELHAYAFDNGGVVWFIEEANWENIQVFGMVYTPKVSHLFGLFYQTPLGIGVYEHKKGWFWWHKVIRPISALELQNVEPLVRNELFIRLEHLIWQRNRSFSSRPELHLA